MKSTKSSELSCVRRSVGEVCDYLEHTQDTPIAWSMRTEDSLLREMVACILGSRVSHEAACYAMKRICESEILQDFQGEHFSSVLQRKLIDQLRGLGSGHGYPFWKIRADQIVRTCSLIYADGNNLMNRLGTFPSETSARNWLVESIPGLGPKQSSMFLRNIGFSKRLAILDVHVLDYMRWNDIPCSAQGRISHLNSYTEGEEQFLRHSDAMKRELNVFDVAVWIVMRVAKSEGYSCR